MPGTHMDAREASPISPELLLAHADWVRRLAVRLVRDPALAEDLAQETWMAVLLHPPSQDRPLRPWLGQVLRNLVIMWARGRGRRIRREQVVAPSAEAPEPSPESLVARVEAQRVLTDLVLALSEPVRETVLLRYIQGLSAADIARRQKIPAGTVRWRLKEGLDQLRSQLDRRAGGDRQAWRAGLVAAFGLPPGGAALTPAAGPALAASASKTPVLAGLATLVLLGALVPLAFTLAARRSHAPSIATASSRALSLLASGGPLGLPGPTSAPGTPAGGLQGLVLDPDGRPLAGAFVAVFDESPESDGPPPAAVAAVNAGADGGFSLTGLPPGSYGLSATARGFAPASASAVKVDAGETRTGLVLRLEPGRAALTGVIEDRGGGVIPGASVRVRPRHGSAGPSPIFQTLADQEGRYLLQVPPGALDIVVDARGYARAQDAIDPRGENAQYRRDFHLTPAGRLRGVVIEAQTGTPVAQAEVTASASRFGFGEGAFAIANDAGIFELDDLEPGEYALRARKGPLAGASGRAFILPTAGFIGDVRLTIQPGAALEGRVRDQAGRPLAGASIRVDEGRVWARSAADGSFRLEGLLPGLVILQPAMRGYGARPVQVEVALGRPQPALDLIMQPAVAIEGRVLAASGAPVAGAAITARTTKLTLPNELAGERRDTRSAADGRFRIDEIAGSEDVFVEAMHREHGVGSATVPQDGRTHHVTISIEPGSSLSGTVRFADGTPAPGASVAVRNGGPSTFSGEDGRYWLGFFQGGKSLELTAANRERWLLRESSVDHSGRRVELRAGEHRTGIDLVVSRETRAISGVVRGPDDRPLEGAVVSAKLVMGTGQAQISIGAGGDEEHTVSAADGTFVLGNLDTETYRVLARYPGYPDAKLTAVVAGTRGLQLRLARAVSLAGVVIDSRGRPAAHYSLLVKPHQEPSRPGSPLGGDQLELYDQVADRLLQIHDASGTFAIGGLPGGVYDLRAETADGATGSLPPVSVAAGEERRGLELRVGAGIVIAGRAVDALTGAPLVGAEVSTHSFVARRSFTTASDGRFRLAPVPRGVPVMIAVDVDPSRSPSEAKMIRTPLDGDAVDAGTIRVFARPLEDGSPAGVGATLWTWPEGTLVDTVAEGTAAARAGIHPGDVFSVVAGRDVSGWGPQGVQALLEGAPGTSVTATVRSGATGAVRTVTLQRDTER